MLFPSLKQKLNTLKHFLKTKIKSFVSLTRKFPHINRKITAFFKTLKFGYFGLIIFLFMIGLNLLSDTLPRSKEQKLQYDILKNPYLSTPHQKLAEFYLDKNQAGAEKEYYLATEMFQRQNSLNDKYLGIESSPWETYLNLLKNKSLVEENQILWEKIKNTFPDYEYAYLKLSSLYTKLGKKEKAYQILAEALKINPGNMEARSLQKKAGN
ncbi:hypothetical protein HY338_00595 [Candidatus Gottesmanbacteria bacterium]|nr:hypothetical protein [Candidatus Gottesmanbacteria bacterium]